MVLLSGPEPQRSILEEILLKEFSKSSGRILFIRGVIDERTADHNTPNLTVKNHLFGRELEQALNSSEVVVARSGYTTLMDLARLEKKAFFIPTPGQFEQEYLADRMHKLGFAPSCRQEEFNLEMLVRVKDYSGLKDPGFVCDFSKLFGLFKGE
jgi:uncharacterized protein (TIGR00661 family)